MASRLLGERYRVEGRLGVGALTETLAAVDRQQDAHVIIEALIAGFAHDTASIELFNGAFQVAAALDHPNIAAVSPAQEVDGQHIVIRALPAGQALIDVIAAHGPLPSDRAARLITGVASALAHAHQMGTTHGALSPACIYVGPDDQVTVSGFGLGARTAVGLDPRYTAPERTDQAPATPASDLYALGCCLHLMLTGQAPVGLAPSDSDPARSGAPAPLLPLELGPIVDRLVADDPEMRYRTAMAVIADLREATATESGVSELLPALDSAIGSWRPGRPWEAAAPVPETPELGDPADPQQLVAQVEPAPDQWHTIAEPLEAGGPADDDQPPLRRHRRALAAMIICLPVLGVGAWSTSWLGGDDGGDGQDTVQTDHDDRALMATSTTSSSTTTTRPDDETTTSSSTTSSSTTTSTSSSTTEPPSTTTLEPPATAPPTTSRPPASTQPPTTQTTQAPTTSTTQDNRVTVPYVVGMRAWDAQAALDERGLNAVYRGEWNCQGGERPTVVAQDPSSGARVAPGSTVTLTVRCRD